MKIEFSIQYNSPKVDIENWLQEFRQEITNFKVKGWGGPLGHVEELIDDFTAFLHAKEPIVDKSGKELTPKDIYHAIEHYKIRFQKLSLIFNLKLYMTHNVNKETGVRYIVMRAMWIDENGKTYRKFSKNLGAESKVVVNGKIPVKIMESVEDYIKTLMWDQYYFEYIDDSEADFDQDGYIMIPRD